MSKTTKPNTAELVSPMRMIVALEAIAGALQSDVELRDIVCSLDHISSELRKTNKWLEELCEQQTDVLRVAAYRRAPEATQPQPGEKVRPQRTNRYRWLNKLWRGEDV